LGYKIRKIVDIDSGEPVQFKHKKNAVIFNITAPLGTTRLLKITH